MSYNNQKFITNEKNFSGIDYARLRGTLSKLNGVALKLYIYFCGYGDKETYPFSPHQIGIVCGVSSMSARRALDELIEKNYVVVDGDKYIFKP